MHHKYFNHTLALLRKNSFLYKVTIRYRKINQIKINTSFNHMSILVTFFFDVVYKFKSTYSSYEFNMNMVIKLTESNHLSHHTRKKIFYNFLLKDNFVSYCFLQSEHCNFKFGIMQHIDNN